MATIRWQGDAYLRVWRGDHDDDFLWTRLAGVFWLFFSFSGSKGNKEVLHVEGRSDVSFENV